MRIEKISRILEAACSQSLRLYPRICTGDVEGLTPAVYTALLRSVYVGHATAPLKGWKFASDLKSRLLLLQDGLSWLWNVFRIIRHKTVANFDSQNVIHWCEPWWTRPGPFSYKIARVFNVVWRTWIQNFHQTTIKFSSGRDFFLQLHTIYGFAFMNAFMKSSIFSDSF